VRNHSLAAGAHCVYGKMLLSPGRRNWQTRWAFSYQRSMHAELAQQLPSYILIQKFRHIIGNSVVVQFQFLEL